MQDAIKASVEFYASMTGMTEIEVLTQIQNGNEVITRTVQMLMFYIAE
jgi:hypothetical protein